MHSATNTFAAVPAGQVRCPSERTTSSGRYCHGWEVCQSHSSTTSPSSFLRKQASVVRRRKSSDMTNFVLCAGVAIWVGMLAASKKVGGVDYREMRCAFAALGGKLQLRP